MNITDEQKIVKKANKILKFLRKNGFDSYKRKKDNLDLGDIDHALYYSLVGIKKNEGDVQKQMKGVNRILKLIEDGEILPGRKDWSIYLTNIV